MAEEAQLVHGGGGFEGTVAGWALADVIQVSACNRMTGCLAVEEGRSRGLLYFVRGEIVHAERGEDVGERAFCEMLASPAGRFRFEPGAPAAARRTVHKNWQQLLLESQWLLDERGRRRSTPAAPPDVPASPPAPAVLAEVRDIPGVAYAVAQRLEGVPLGDASERAGRLARQARYLAVYGRQLGSIFGAGDVTSAAAQGRDHHLLCLAAGGYSLGVLVDGASEVAAAESALRAAVGQGSPPPRGATRADGPGASGSMVCDVQGGVVEASFSPQLARARLAEAALLVANATGALEVATGKIDLVRFVYTGVRIAVTPSEAGYAVALA